jgi:prostaglandin-endoperoxide synthase 2
MVERQRVGIEVKSNCIRNCCTPKPNGNGAICSFAYIPTQRKYWRKLRMQEYLTYLFLNYILPHLSIPVKILFRVPIVGKRVFQEILLWLSRSAKTPFKNSTYQSFTSIDSITNKLYYVRYLPESKGPIDLPNVDDPVSSLFKRTQEIKDNRITLLLMSFAQFFLNDILSTNPQNPKETLGVNTIKLGALYGINRSVQMQIRSLQKGMLKSQQLNGEEYPPYLKDNKVEYPLIENRDRFLTNKDKSDFFAFGMIHMNNHPGTIAVTTLLLREHNRICKRLSLRFPTWDDERLFQTARNIVTASCLKIIIEDYVKVLADKIDFLVSFKPSWLYNSKWVFAEKQIPIEYNLLYRWHSLVPDNFVMNGVSKKFEDTFYNTKMVIDNGIEQVFSDLGTQYCTRLGLCNTPRYLLMAEASAIKTSRDLHLMSYNMYRREFGLPAAKKFSDITSDKAIQRRLSDLYKDVENVEFYVGLLAEDHIGNNRILGQLMLNMLWGVALSGVLGHPLLAESVYNKDTFTEFGMELINKTNLTKMIQKNVRLF